eukprot:12487196-Alexandrium_andersonii.AAC.1
MPHPTGHWNSLQDYDLAALAATAACKSGLRSRPPPTGRPSEHSHQPVDAEEPPFDRMPSATLSSSGFGRSAAFA